MQIRFYLSDIDGNDATDGFQFDYHAVIHDQIQSMLSNKLSSIPNLNGSFAIDNQT